MRNVSLLRKTTIFQMLALSKIIRLALVTNVSTATIKVLSKIQKESFRGNISLRLNMTPYVMIMKM